MVIEENKKECLLKYYGYDSMEGYCMNHEQPEDCHLSVFISKEEWIEKTLEGCKKYYWNKYSESVLTLDEAWECLEEDIWNQEDLGSEDKVNAFLEQLYADIIEGKKPGRKQ